ILTIEMTPNITEEVFFRNGCTTGKRKEKQMNGLRREKEELEIRMWRKGIPPTLLVGMQVGTATLENSVEVP
uniref:Uncharacterized protein n=1 Tax=Ursus americanus TaxID=9643 RepID=A0A452SS33_URSAM